MKFRPIPSPIITLDVLWGTECPISKMCGGSVPYQSVAGLNVKISSLTTSVSFRHYAVSLDGD